MDISVGEDDLGPDFLTPFPLPEVDDGSAEELTIQNSKNNTTDNVGNVEEAIVGNIAPYVQRPSVGSHLPRASTQSSSQESSLDAG